ncbi:MAG: hypothetical protein ABWY23_11110 [Mycetocola sp.]
MVDLLRWYCGGEVEEVAAHAAGDDSWQEDGTAALVRFDNGHTGVLLAARNAGGWEELLDAYGASTSVHVDAPDRISVTRFGETVVREMRAEAFGWATATSTFGFQASVDHFLECVRDRSQPLTSGRGQPEPTNCLIASFRLPACRRAISPIGFGRAMP